MNKDEILGIVDINDQVIGQKNRSEVYAKKMSNFRVINALIVNSKGQLWIPRRTKHKRIFPLYLDVSVGGHVESGESYEVSFERELKEELNLEITQIKYSVLGHLTPHENNVSAFQVVYKIEADIAPDFNKDDFLEYFWLTPDELFKRIEDGDKAKDDLPKIVKLFFK